MGEIHNSDNAAQQGSGFARGAAGSLLAKPSGRAVGGTMVDRAMDKVMPMPDFATDPAGWTSQMKAQMWTALEAKGIVNTTNVNDLMRAALKDGKPGDKRSVFRCLYRHRRAFERRMAAGKAQRDFEKTVERWLVSDCALKPDIVRLVIKQSDIANTQRSLLARLVDVTIMSVEQQFNARRQYAAHWAANALDGRVVGLWRDVHETGIAAGWTLQERVQKLNIALGGVAHIYMYPRSPEQAIAAFKEAFGDGKKPIEPPRGEEKMTSPAAVAAPAKTSGNRFATFFESFNNICKLNGVAEDKAIRDAIRHSAAKKLYNVESFEDLPDDANMGNLLREIKTELADPEKIEDYLGRQKVTDVKPQDTENLNEKASPAVQTPIAGNDGQRIENKPVVEPVLKPANNIIAFPEKVPSAFTAVLINGHEVHVTAYAGQSSHDVAETVFALLDGLGEVLNSDRVKSYAAVTDGRDRLTLFKDNGKRLEQPTPLALPAPAQQQPVAPSAPAAQSSDKGTAMCALIKVARSFEGNKPQLQFECNGFEKSLKYTREPLINILRGVTNPFTGQPFTAADMTDNSMYGGAFLVDWERKEKDGKTFTNVLAVRNAGQLAKTG